MNGERPMNGEWPMRGWIWIVACVLFAGPASAAAQDLVIQGGEIRPVSGPAIEDGVVVVRDGRIAEIGPSSTVDVPSDMEIVDADGMVVTPGFIDAGTTMGRDRGGPEHLIRSPSSRVVDELGEPRVPGAFGMEAEETAVHPWVTEGVTTVYVTPPAESLVAGFGTIVKLEGDRFGEVLAPAAALHGTLGDEPRRAFDAPTTRQGMVAALRQWLAAARDAAVAGADTFRVGPPFSQIEEAEEVLHPVTPELRAVLAGATPVRIRAQAPDDVLAAIRVTRELDLRLIVEGASGAHVVSDALSEADVSVVLGPVIVGSGANTPEAFARTYEAAAILSRAGIPLALSTEGSGGRAVTVEAAVAVGHGFPETSALQAVTLGAARLLGVDQRIGSLDQGKDADLVLWSDEPLGTWTEAEVVVVGGRVVWRR